MKNLHDYRERSAQFGLIGRNWEIWSRRRRRRRRRSYLDHSTPFSSSIVFVLSDTIANLAKLNINIFTIMSSFFNYLF